MTNDQFERASRLLNELEGLKTVRDRTAQFGFAGEVANSAFCERHVDLRTLLKGPLATLQRAALDKMDTRIAEIEAEFAAL